MLHQAHEMRVIERLDQSDIIAPAQRRLHHRANIRIRMDREDHRHILALCKVGDGLCDFLHALPEILAPMRGTAR